MSSATSKVANGALELTVVDGLGWLTLDLPGEKVNKLSSSVMTSLAETLSELARRSDLEGIVIRSAKEGIFIAGADVKEIQTITRREDAIKASRVGHEIFQKIQDLPFPAVAAIDGVCVGGGTELALACHGRLGTDHPRFGMGLPEVNLGIIPAWGGSTRLPRLVGLQEALELILTGRNIDAKKAERIGLIDRAVPHTEIDKHAVELVRKLRRQGHFRKKVARRTRGLAGWLLEGNPLGRAIVFQQARKKVLARSQGHYPAPIKALEVIRRGLAMKLEGAFELEAEALSELVVGTVSKNLVHLFFLTEKAKKDPGIEQSVESVAKVGEVRAAGLLGAGTMGGAMAWALSSRDIPVRFKDVRPEALGAGLAAARRIYDRRAKRGRMNAWELDKKMSFISPTLDWSGFSRADVVLEAIIEDMNIKKKVLEELEPEISDTCLIGSNTSTLPITDLQSGLGLPERMAGFHFFNPVDRMPLIEVIRGEATSDKTVAAFVALAKRLGKTPVVVADGPGFLVNRVLGPYLNEACHLLLDTGDIEGIDRALVEFGMPMGPLRLLDEVGIDVADKASTVLASAYGDRAAPAGVIGKLAASKRLGKKTGSGLYIYEDKKPRPAPDVLELLGIETRRSIDSKEAVERSIDSMITEAARALEENVVRSPEELDLAMVMGIGFPPFRGGLLRYADSVGLSVLVDRLRAREGSFGSRFQPPDSLVRRAKAGKGFY